MVADVDVDAGGLLRRLGAAGQHEAGEQRPGEREMGRHADMTPPPPAAFPGAHVPGCAATSSQKSIAARVKRIPISTERSRGAYSGRSPTGR